jgi:hypothetical protein
MDANFPVYHSATVDKNILLNKKIYNISCCVSIKTTESDVFKICSKRPVTDAILREVYQNKKWISRYIVKKALIFNPYSPTEIGLKLIHFMMEQDLRLVASCHDTHPLIRNTAIQKIESGKADSPTPNGE